MSVNTTRLALPTTQGTDQVSNYPSIDAAAKAILDNAAIWSSSVIASRPNANTVAAGTYHLATDTTPVTLAVSDGANWRQILPVAADFLSDAAKLGLTDSTNVRRGQFNQVTSGSRTNVAYGALTNGPDIVSSVVVPANAKVRLRYSAVWQETVAAAARAAIFISGNQLKIWRVGATGLSAATMGSAPTANTDTPLVSFPGGLISMNNGGSAAIAEPTTGLAIALFNGGSSQIEIDGSNAYADTIVGGECEIYIPTGTYDFEVKYKSSSGSVSAKNRRLWVETVGF